MSQTEKLNNLILSALCGLMIVTVGLIGWLGQRAQAQLDRQQDNIESINKLLVKHDIVLDTVSADVNDLKKRAQQWISRQELNRLKDDLTPKYGPVGDAQEARKDAGGN